MVATGSWWILLWALWAFDHPANNLADAAWLRPVWDLFGLPVPSAAGLLDGIIVQHAVLLSWSVPVLLLSAAAFGAGFLTAWKRHSATFNEAEDRKAGTGDTRGVKTTLGVCPAFPSLNREDLEFASDAADALPEGHKALLSAVFSVLMAYPDAYFDGEGDLASHAGALALRELDEGGKYPGLSAIAASARLLGNITSFVKKDGKWVQVKKDVHRQGELLMTSLPEWWLLEEVERTALAWAIGYWDNTEEIPIAPEPIARLALAIQKSAKNADQEVAAEAALEAVAKTSKESSLIDILLAKLPTLPFQNGLPKGVQAVGWRKGSRVYLIENQLVDKYLIQEVPADRRKALLDVPRGAKVSNFTRELLRLLKERGWLVTQEAGFSLDWDQALWKLQAGKVLYKRIIALDMANSPADMEMLPSDSIYPVKLTEPQFVDVGKPVFGASDLGGLIKSSSGTPPAKKPAYTADNAKNKDTPPPAPGTGDPADK